MSIAPLKIPFYIEDADQDILKGVIKDTKAQDDQSVSVSSAVKIQEIEVIKDGRSIADAVELVCTNDAAVYFLLAVTVEFSRRMLLNGRKQFRRKEPHLTMYLKDGEKEEFIVSEIDEKFKPRLEQNIHNIRSIRFR